LTVKLDPQIMHQVFQPWIQRRKLAYAKHKHVISGILKHAQMQSLGRLLNDDGTPNEDVIRKCDPLNTLLYTVVRSTLFRGNVMNLVLC